MNNIRLNSLKEQIPQINNLTFDNEDELISQLLQSGETNWNVIKFLITERLIAFFKKKHGTPFHLSQSIYHNDYFEDNSTVESEQFEQFADLRFPIFQMRFSRLIILLSIFLIWSFVVFSFSVNYSEAQYFGSFQDRVLLGPAGGFLFIPLVIVDLIPIVLIHYFAPKWLYSKKFKRVDTFEELIDSLFTINVYRYRINNCERLKHELTAYLNAS
jgi:hypothetical protein